MKVSSWIHAPAASLPRNKPGTHHVGGFIDPRPDPKLEDKNKNSCIYRDSNPRRSSTFITPTTLPRLDYYYYYYYYYYLMHIHNNHWFCKNVLSITLKLLKNKKGLIYYYINLLLEQLINWKCLLATACSANMNWPILRFLEHKTSLC